MARRFAMRSYLAAISPIVSAIILFIIALAVAGIVAAFISAQSSHVVSLIDLVSSNIERAIQEDLEVVYITTDQHGTIFIGIMNTGPYPIKVLDIYVNGTRIPHDDIEVRCAQSETDELPLEMLSGDLCVLEIEYGIRADLYIVTIATESASYSIGVYGP